MKEYFTGTDRFSEAHQLDGAMLSAYALRGRKSPPSVGRWMLDSGAFTQVTNYGDFIQSPADYVRLAVRFQDAGMLACIVSQDYMCEPSVIAELQAQGRQASVRIHQRKSVDRYVQIVDEGIKQGLMVPVMPVLQGWEVEDYVDHYHIYRRMLREIAYNRPWKDRYGNTIRSERGLWKHPFSKYPLVNRPWVGIGSTCKRNANPEFVSQILDAVIPLLPSNTKIHLFGFKKTGLAQANIKDRIYSADSFAYDFADRMAGKKRTSRRRIKSARKFGYSIIHNNVQTNLDYDRSTGSKS